MKPHSFAKHPLHIAALLLLAGYAQAQDLSINSMTLDTASGKSLGNISRRGEMKNFFQVQKEMVFNTLSQLGVKLEDLPPKLRQEIEKPQTTNAQAFAAFAKAVDKADKGQFAQAAQLFKQAAKLDPAFGLAKGMAVLMPKFDLAPGDAKKVLADLKKDAKDDGKKQGEKLAGDVDKKEKDLKSDGKGDKTKDKLAKLADGEEGDKKDKEEKQSGVKKKLDKLGLSDEGDDSGFDPNEAGEEDPNKIETASIGGGGSMDPLLLAQNLDLGLPPLPDPLLGAFPDLSFLNQANDDQRREDLGGEPAQGGSGSFGAILDGQFIGGGSALSFGGEGGASATLTLTREGGTEESITFNLDSGGAHGSYAGENLFGASGEFSGEITRYGSDAYLISVSQTDSGFSSEALILSSDAVNKPKPVLMAVAGTATPASALPNSGVQSMSLTGLLTDETLLQGYDAFALRGLVDWRTNKVFSPVAMREQNDGVLVLGGVNRTKSSLEAGVWWLDGYEPDVGFVSGQSDDIDIPLLGSTRPVLGGGLFSTEERDLSGQLLRRNEGIIVAQDFASASASNRTPADGETWSGFSVGVGQWSGSGYFTYQGTSQFTFTPSTGDVTGKFNDGGSYVFLSTSVDDPNAFINKDAFGAKTTNGFGNASYFSTQGDFTGPGWTDLNYTSMGYWAHDDEGEGHLRFLDYSTWVAGQLTPANPQMGITSGSAYYTGKVLGAIQSGNGSGDPWLDLITGNVNVTVSFGDRSLAGAFTELRRDWDNSIWLDRADFAISGFSGNAYSGFLTGTGIDSFEINGSFYGPNAEETGGAWRIKKSDDDWAAGVYAAKRGNIYTPFEAKWAGVANGVFLSGNAEMHRDDRGGTQDPKDVILTLEREGFGNGIIEYRSYRNRPSDPGSTTDFPFLQDQADALWTDFDGTYRYGSARNYGDDAYFADYTEYGYSPYRDYRLTAFGGVRTTEAQLPATGVRVYSMTALSADSGDTGTYTSYGDMAVDFTTNKVFMPVEIHPDRDSALIVLGSMDRQSTTLNVQGWDKNTWPDGNADPNWAGNQANVAMSLYGGGANVTGGLFSGTDYDYSGSQTGTFNGTFSGYTYGWDGGYSYRLPVDEGQSWTGFSANLVKDRESGGFQLGDGGVVDFQFFPGSGRVLASFYEPDVIGTTFSNGGTDPNVFIATNAFGGLRDYGEGDRPFYYSTRSTYTGWENLSRDSLSSYHDMLEYHYVGMWTADHGVFSVLPASTWVAGAQTPSANLPASGYVRYTGYASGVVVNNTGYDYLSGLFSMTADFTTRSVNGAIDNLTAYHGGPFIESGFDFLGDMNVGAYGGLLPTFQSTSIQGRRGMLYAGGIDGMFYGLSGAAAREVGGRWWMDVTYGGSVLGIFSARDQSQLYWSAGMLTDMGADGAVAISNPLVARVNNYSYFENSVDKQGIYAQFVLPGQLGEFETGNIAGNPSVANRPYYQWSMTQSDDSKATGLRDKWVYVDGYYDYYRDSFKTSSSYVQYTDDFQFYRYYLVDTTGLGKLEGYYGDRTWNVPFTGISTYDFHQSSIENGVGNSSMLTGQNGLFPGKLYVNWETGQVYGYNLDPAVEGGGRAMFLGTVNRETGKIEGTYQIRTDRLVASDDTQSSRFAMDAAGVSLDLFGNSGTPSGLGGVFATALQGEDLYSQPTSGQALITGLRDKLDVTPAVQPAEGEVWNGYAVGFATERSTGITKVLGNTDAQQVEITFSPGYGHVHGNILVEDGDPEVPTTVNLSIASDNNPATEAERQAGTNVDSASVYVSPKAFGMVQASPTANSGASTTEFIAAAPEAIGEAEAARYDYTTWGAWGGDFGTDKNTTVSPRSLWVAGKLTQTADMPQSGTANYTGFVAGQVSGAQSGYVQGQLNMNVNFQARTVDGSMNNLNFNNNPATPWITQANIQQNPAGNWAAGSVQYTAQMAGSNVTAGALAGAFFGPGAVETGGNWAIQKQDGSLGAGIFAGKKQ